MQTFFVEIKCKLGKTYEVAMELADREIASEIYSTAGDYDILAKFHIDRDVDIGHFRRREGSDHSGDRRHQDDHHLQGILSRNAASARARRCRDGARYPGQARLQSATSCLMNASHFISSSIATHSSAWCAWPIEPGPITMVGIPATLWKRPASVP